MVHSELVSQYSSHGSWSLHNGLNIHWWYVSNYNQNRTSLTCSSSNWCSSVADYGAFCCKNQCFVVYSELVSQYSSHGSWSLHNGLNIHWWYVLSPLCWNSNKSKHPRRVKNRRHKRPCTYYSNSTATFHLLLQGDLVFKLNPGPEEYQISSIVSSRLNTHQHMSTDRNRNLDNLCNIRCLPYNWTSTTNIFSLCLLNTRSIRNKIAELTDFVCDHKPDLLAVTETWLGVNDCAVRAQICPTGYRFADHGRDSRRGGGTGLFYRDSLNVIKVEAAELHSFEYSEWIINIGSQRTRLVIIYRPPYSAAHPVTVSTFLCEFAGMLESLVLSIEPLLITGDFNIHVNCADDPDTVGLLTLLESTGLEQHVKVPTHINGNFLDLIISRQSDSIVDAAPWTDSLFSDHMPVFCSLKLDKPSFTKSRISYRKLKSIDTECLRKDLSQTSLCKDLDNMELADLVMCYNETLTSTLDRHAPLITKTIVKRPIVPWFTDEVKAAKRQRRIAEKKWRRTKLPCDFLAYKAKRNYATFVMKRARRHFYTNFIAENSNDQGKLFRAAKSLFVQKSELTFPDYRNSSALANDIGEYFVRKIDRVRSELDSVNPIEDSTSCTVSHSVTPIDSFNKLDKKDVRELIAESSKKSCSLDPMPTPLVLECSDVLLPSITRMINLSLEAGTFPEPWKLADVHPRLKKPGAESAFMNLRPISNLTFVSKLTERAAFNQINQHCLENNLYPKNQSSYRKLHSTETALLRVKNDILTSMNKQHVVLLVLLDLSSAFDTVDHTILLNRLNSTFGITGSAHKWFNSYLTRRSQFVTVNGATSKTFDLQYGVPQGSCLGPLLFILYASRLFDILESHLPNSHMYADDTQLYLAFKPDDAMNQITAVTAMQNAIDDIKKWMLADKLKLNDGKSEFMIIGTRQQLAKVSVDTLRVGNVQLTPLSEARNLGCWFDSQLSMVTHIHKVCKAAFYHLYNLRKIRKFLDNESIKTLVNALITSRLDYCNSLLFGTPATHLLKLQRVQNTAARLICNMSRFDHITPTLIHLHWLPVKFRIDFKILLITFKVIHGLAPEYLHELICVKAPSRYHLRSNDQLLLSQPKFKSLKTLGDRAFISAAPNLWNSLPNDIRSAKTVDHFKKLVKTHLFKIAFY